MRIQTETYYSIYIIHVWLKPLCKCHSSCIWKCIRQWNIYTHMNVDFDLPVPENGLGIHRHEVGNNSRSVPQTSPLFDFIGVGILYAIQSDIEINNLYLFFKRFGFKFSVSTTDRLLSLK